LDTTQVNDAGGSKPLPSADNLRPRPSFYSNVALISTAATVAGVAEPNGVSDSGCVGIVISKPTYDHLRDLALVPEMQPTPQPRSIRFSTTQDGTDEPILGEVMVPGMLVDRIAVVNSVAATLIGDDIFTSKGVIMIRSDTHVIGFHGTTALFYGTRDPKAIRGTFEGLWRLDLAQLCRIPDPRTRTHPALGTTPGDTTVAQLVASLNAAGDSMPTQCRLGDGATAGAFSTRQVRHSPASVRMARRLIKASGLSARTIGKAIAAEAWKDVPPDLSDALFRAIAEKRDDIPYILSHSRAVVPQGSGITPGLGVRVSFDTLGKWQATAGGRVCYGVILRGSRAARHLVGAVFGR